MKPSSAIVQRYKPHGGLAGVREKIGKGEATLTEIARSANVSAETVRNDLKRQFGDDGYATIIAANTAARQARTKVYEGTELSADLCREALRSQKLPYNKQLNEACLLAVDQLTSKAKATHFKLGAKGLKELKTSKGWTTVKVYVVQSDSTEYPLGLIRFRPTEIQGETDQVVYIVCHNRKLSTYVFKRQEIHNLTSLALRFDKHERRHKWRYAKERWQLL